MERNALQLTADGRDTRAGAFAIDRIQAVQQAQRRVNTIGRRRFKPFERQRIGTPCEQVEDGRGEIDPRNLRFAVRAQPIARGPQPPYEAGP